MRFRSELLLSCVLLQVGALPLTVSAQSGVPDEWARWLAAGEVHIQGLEAAGDADTAPENLGHAVILSGPSGRTLSLPTPACALLLDRLHERAPEWSLSSLGTRVDVRLGRVRSGDRVLFDLRHEVCDTPLEHHTDHRYVDVRVRSLVGPLLTLSLRRSEALAGGPPYHHEEWRTVDARTGRSVELTAVVEERSLVAAIQRDPYVQRELAHAADRIRGARTMAQLRAILVESDHEGFESFAVAGYDPRSHEALVRLAFRSSECGLCPNEVRMLGLRVRVLPRWRAAFAAAARGDGLLIGGAEPRVS